MKYNHVMFLRQKSDIPYRINIKFRKYITNKHSIVYKIHIIIIFAGTCTILTLREDLLWQI